jgi:hypothetical protein
VSAFNDVITLIKVKPAEKDEMSFSLPSKDDERRDVFCKTKSVGQNEFYNSFMAGVKATNKFEMWEHEYNNEKVIEFKGTRFRVLRSYIGKNSEIIELTVTDIGVNIDELH